MEIPSPNSRIVEINVSKKPETESVDQRYILKCNFRLWSTSYVDISGNINLPGNSMPCPRCRKGLIEVETSMNKKIFVIPAYLDYVLSD